MEIRKVHQEFSVCQVEDYSFVNLGSEYSFIGKTDEEKSLVCITNEVPPNVIQREDGWKAFRIQGVLDFLLIGVLSKKMCIRDRFCICETECRELYMAGFRDAMRLLMTIGL